MDADVIAVHIVFHAFYESVRSELALHRVPVRMWPRVVHRKLYYKLAKVSRTKNLLRPQGSFDSCLFPRCGAAQITLSS